MNYIQREAETVFFYAKLIIFSLFSLYSIFFHLDFLDENYGMIVCSNFHNDFLRGFGQILVTKLVKFPTNFEM